jgi:hypothetical protein
MEALLCWSMHSAGVDSLYAILRGYARKNMGEKLSDITSINEPKRLGYCIDIWFYHQNIMRPVCNVETFFFV